MRLSRHMPAHKKCNGMGIQYFMQKYHILFALPALATVYACAPISRESCLNDSSYDIGYAAAMDNADQADRLRSIDKICAKQGRTVELAEYNKGFEAGTRVFCAPDNGYRWGLRGRGYNGICADPVFGAAYDDGLRLYKIEQRKTEIRNRLDSIRSGLDATARLLDEGRGMTEERKRELLREQDRLLLERSDLLAEQRSLGLGI